MTVEGCVGLTRVRNEASILRETLDHFAPHCDMGVVVVDDASTDDTARIAEEHPSVVAVIRNLVWNANRPAEEWRLRQVALDEARLLSPRWLVCFDADERIEMDEPPLDEKADSIALRLFDAYITEEDASLVGTRRRWFGPEYRDIVFFFRNDPRFSYWLPDQRVIAGVERTVLGGFARHYGKAISVEEHELTCDYYAEHFPEPYRSKWLARRGRAVHTDSDFGRPLVLWPDVTSHGIQLHDASAPPAAPSSITEAMSAARPSGYLCGVCGAPLVSVRSHEGNWRLACSGDEAHEWRHG